MHYTGTKEHWMAHMSMEIGRLSDENKELKKKLKEYEELGSIKEINTLCDKFEELADEIVNQRTQPYSIRAMLTALQKFHDKHGFGEQGRKNPHSRITYLTEELGEVAECISKGKDEEEWAEEHADLFIVLLGNCLCFEIDIEEAFWKKYETIMNRPSKIVDGLVRLSKEDE
jgi:NTP pyrophosphatase (non-canonical NTP hydrolase)